MPCEQTSDRDRSNRSGYAYLNLAYPYRFIWTLGASYDDLDVGPLAKARANPKLGAQWDATDSLRLRAAYFETLRRSLIVEQTLEPTQVAGFTQFFDDRSGTEAKRYGVGVDAKLTDKVLGGAEWSKRDLRVPQFAGNSVTFQNRDEDLLRAYLYWTPVRHWALSAESRT